MRTDLVATCERAVFTQSRKNTLEQFCELSVISSAKSMTMALLWVAALLSISVCSAMPPFGSSFFPGNRQHPRCSSASKPCRIKVDMHRISVTTETIAAELCSCPTSKPCSTDWEGDANRVITRELATTNSDTDMTLSMMFCNEVQPPMLCTDNETALEVAGLSTLPQEVDVFRCACADSRPLVIDEMYLDSNHVRHMKYVCPNFKRRCNIRRTNRDECTLFSDHGNRIQYPCKCPSRTSCEPDFSIPFETTPLHRCVWQ